MMTKHLTLYVHYAIINNVKRTGRKPLKRKVGYYMMKKLVLVYKGRDSWSRPVYEANGRLYVDVNPVKDKAACICTKYQNDFDGEPDCHIRSDIEIEFSPCRDTW